MALLVEVVEHELSYLRRIKELQVPPEFFVTLYLRIAENLGVQGPANSQLSYIERGLHNLHSYFCQLYDQPPLVVLPPPEDGNPLFKAEGLRELVSELLLYWQVFKVCQGGDVLDNPSPTFENVRECLAPSTKAFFESLLDEQICNLQVLAKTLDLIHQDNVTTLPSYSLSVQASLEIEDNGH